MIRYYVSDSSPEDLSIWTEDSDDEPDGEFIFATFKEAQEACFERIDRTIKLLKRNRKYIEEQE